MANNEQVIHPSHYNHGGRRECWDEMMDIDQVATALFDLWSAYKYSYRAGTKDGNPASQDLAKIRNYISHAEEIHNNMIFDGASERAYILMLKELEKYI